MRILVLNPNTSESMTAEIEFAERSAASPIEDRLMLAGLHTHWPLSTALGLGR